LHGFNRAAKFAGEMCDLNETGGAGAIEAVSVFESKIAFTCEIEVYAVYMNEFGGYCRGPCRVSGLRVDVNGTTKCVRVIRGRRCVFRLRDDGRCT